MNTFCKTEMLFSTSFDCNADAHFHTGIVYHFICSAIDSADLNKFDVTKLTNRIWFADFLFDSTLNETHIETIFNLIFAHTHTQSIYPIAIRLLLFDFHFFSSCGNVIWWRYLGIGRSTNWNRFYSQHTQKLSSSTVFDFVCFTITLFFLQ